MSPAVPEKIRQRLKAADLTGLFVEELGWNHLRGRPHRLLVDGDAFLLTPVAEKGKFAVYACSADPHGRIPPYPVRRKIDRQLAKLAHEHVVVYLDETKTHQIWQWVRRGQGRGSMCREHVFRASQTGEALVQRLRGLAFSLREEDDLTIVHVADRARMSFDVERITKRFYERFTDEHTTFAGFIKGLASRSDREWYSSLMLNRMMFVYFIQKKGFLAGDQDYLRNRLRAMQAGRKKDSFHRFYRFFLLRLFHEGLARPASSRASDLAELLGDVPYLNGGLFDVHELERKDKDITIPDDAFERVFTFFDAYTWHLDDRPARADNEINPDVLGFIFEKYINQKAMGAYYTKDDITGYIGCSTIIPSLVDTVGRVCPSFVARNGPLRELLRAEPDQYIQSALLTGAEGAVGQEGAPPPAERRHPSLRNEVPVPGVEISGQDAKEKARRQRSCAVLRKTLAEGEPVCADNLVTLNVNLAKLVEDAIGGAQDPDVVWVLWESLVHLSVLDPTCGSGAFLFAALGILEPLYTACLDAMEGYAEDAESGHNTCDPARLKDFRQLLDEVNRHPNREYFVLKTIVVGNLYGVDIMPEAVEICKLRLFLKLVAQVDEVAQLEPLPDIDFNVRSGNALVGFSTEDEVRGTFEGTLDFGGSLDRIEREAELADEAFQAFRALQTMPGHAEEIGATKVVLQERLESLRAELDFALAGDYVVGTRSPGALRKWQDAHQPFHWFVEFYGIMKSGGFDVIIGNPPYVEIPRDMSRALLRKHFRTALPVWSRDEDLYTLVVERSLGLLRPARGKCGLIVPLSLAFSTKKPFVELRRRLMLERGRWWWSHFDRIPSALFGNEVRTRCTIAILSRRDEAMSWEGFTTALMRWESDKREELFPLIEYARTNVDIVPGIPKVGSQIQADALEGLLRAGAPLGQDLRQPMSFAALAAAAPEFPPRSVYVGGTAYNWFPVWREIPETTTATGSSSLPARTAGFRFETEKEANVVFALLASSLGYWWWAVASDGFNLKRWLIERFPVSASAFKGGARDELASLGAALAKALRKHYVYKDNRGRIGNFYLPACAREVEAIDEALARYVSGLSSTFFEDVRAFNNRFSRAEAPELGEDDPEDG